jgi:hypothetical protein
MEPVIVTLWASRQVRSTSENASEMQDANGSACSMNGLFRSVRDPDRHQIRVELSKPHCRSSNKREPGPHPMEEPLMQNGGDRRGGKW